MGPGFMSRQAAAQQLGVTERTIFKYVRDGWLGRVVQGEEVGVSRRDVQSLTSESRQTPLQCNRRTVELLRSRVELMADRVRQAELLLDLQQPLGMNMVALTSLLLRARDCLRDGWEAGAETMWAAVFLKLSSEDLDRVGRASKNRDDTYPWIPFFRLCLAMQKAARAPELLTLLRLGRANIERLALTWRERHGFDLPGEFRTT
jgi:hypothetical protein